MWAEKPVETLHELNQHNLDGLTVPVALDSASKAEQRRLVRKLDMILLPLASGCVLRV